MEKRNIVFIAKSLDGYIADKNGGLDWLHSVPNPDQLDMGYNELNERIDAILMGRKTYDVVCSFNIPWPYSKPVFVVSNTLNSIRDQHKNKVEIVKGSIPEILKYINEKGHLQLYIDGGTLIQSFLKDDLIDEMILTTIPILLGGGAPLFGDLPKPMDFERRCSKVFLDAITQDTYSRKR